MTLRKLTLATVASMALVSGAFAMDMGNGQWGVGAAMIAHDGTTTAGELTYLNSMFIAQGGVGYHNITGTSSEYHSKAYATNLSFGLRNMMNNQVSLDYGINGGYGFESNKDATHANPYNIGAFVGLDFQPIQNVLLTAAVDPYNYSRHVDKDKDSRVLNSGTISVSYLF